MLLRIPDAGGGGGGKPIRDQKILLWVEAPADKLKLPESGLNYALKQLGQIHRMMILIGERYDKLAGKRLPVFGGLGSGRSGSGGGGGGSSSASGSAASDLIKAIKREDGSSEVISALNRAETLLRRVRTNKKGEERSEDIDLAQKGRAAALREELSLARARHQEDLRLAHQQTDERQKQLRIAEAHKQLADDLRNSDSQKTPAQKSAFDLVASTASKNQAVAAAKAQAVADAEAKAKALKDAENNAMKAQGAAFSSAMGAPGGGNLKLAHLQGRAAYQQQMVNFHKTSGNMGALLQHTNALAVANATLAHATAQVNAQYSHVGKNMLQNVAHVTAWAAAVGTLYGGLRLLRGGADSVIELEYAMARLGQVFRGNRDEVPRLTDDVLKLAAANGRSSKEATDSAIQWSRLNLNRAEVTEAVRVSLMGANVAELTAAQSTEHLASLYQVYGLRVTQLNSVLGMLNHTSNTHNVTNKAMLEGITRTSAAAKQAGLNLAELIGLIGAGVGATGQSGPNIANSLKSFIGSLSSPEKQKMMRDQFQFEVTVGGTDEIKDMSALLADLFVAFQRMSNAERQSMLFNVAGKHQASRLTAIMDNYIRAQVLAINAQLNLNSAEEENNAIRETAKAKLQGLVSEMERFALNAATAGPAFKIGKEQFDLSALGGFKEIITGMKGVVAVMNVGGGGVGSGFLALIAALSAKLLLMNATLGQTGKQAGVVRNTVGALSSALASYNAMADKAWQSSNRLSLIWGRMGAAAAGTAAAVRTAGTALVSTAKLAMAVPEMLLFAGVIYGLTKAWNAMTEAAGLSSDKADAQMQDMAQRSESAKSAAEAAQTQIKLYDTMQKALGANATRGGRANLIEQMMGGVPEARRDALRKALTDANQEGSALKRNAAFRKALEDESREAAGRAAAERVRQHRVDLDNIRALRAEIKRLENSPLGQADAIKQRRDQLAMLQNQGVARALADVEGQDDASRRFRETNAGHLLFLEKQKGLLEIIKDLYAQIPGDSAVDRHRKTILALETEGQLLEAQLRVANERRAALGGGAVDAAEAVAAPNERRAEMIRRMATSRFEASRMEQRNAETQAARNRDWGNAFEAPFRTARDRYFGYDSSVEGQLGFDPFAQGGEERLAGMVGPGQGGSQRMQDRRELLNWVREYNRLMREAQDAQRTSGAGRTGEFQAVEARAQALREDAERNARELAKQRQLKDAARYQDRMGIVSRVTLAQSDAAAVGNNETQKLNAQIAYNKAMMESLTIAGRQAATQKAASEARQAALIHEEQMMKQQEQLLVRKFQLEQQARQAEKDFSRQMMFDSPGNILKRMAMDKLTNGGRNLKGFMGFDEAGRNMVRPMMEARGEQGENAKMLAALGIKKPGDLADKRDGNDVWRDALSKAVGKGMEPLFVQAAAGALEIGKLQSAAAGAAATVTQFANEIRRVLGQPALPAQGAPVNPQTPQQHFLQPNAADPQYYQPGQPGFGQPVSR